MELSIDVLYLLFLLLGSFASLRFWYRKEIRLCKNARRPIMIFKSEDSDMEVETKLLRDVGLFHVDEEPTDKHQMTDRLSGYGLVIIGYSKKMKDFDTIFSAVKAAHIPVIVYGDLPDELAQDLRKYSWHCMCRTPLRLVNDVLGILSTFPHEKS